MTRTLITIWFTTCLLLVGILYVLWLDTFSLSDNKYELLKEHTKLDRLSATKYQKYRVVLIGTSLTKAGFSSKKTLKRLFAKHNLDIEFIKITVGSALSTELEPAIIESINSPDVDLVLVEANPWTLNFGSGHKYTKHRYWISTRFLSLLNLVPTRYGQKHGDNKDLRIASLKEQGKQKFYSFTPQYNAPSPRFMSDIKKNKAQTKKARFFYPNWSKEIAQLKGAAWHNKLRKTQRKLSKDTNIKFLPNIPSFSYKNYNDHVHANQAGSKHYDQWLIENIQAELGQLK